MEGTKTTPTPSNPSPPKRKENHSFASPAVLSKNKKCVFFFIGSTVNILINETTWDVLFKIYCLKNIFYSNLLPITL